MRCKRLKIDDPSSARRFVSFKLKQNYVLAIVLIDS